MAYLVMGLVSLAVIAVVGVVVWVGHKTENDTFTIGTDDSIDVSPTIVDSMKRIGQWEFLAISDEELVDTVRKGFFGDDELVRIYYGKLRLGIDFSTCSSDWIKTDGDTIRIALPEIKLLDENFIDEASTKSFFETGKWTNKDRKQMYEKARRKMRARCLTKQNMDNARSNAKEQVTRMLQPIASPKIIKISD